MTLSAIASSMNGCLAGPVRVCRERDGLSKTETGELCRFGMVNRAFRPLLVVLTDSTTGDLASARQISYESRAQMLSKTGSVRHECLHLTVDSNPRAMSTRRNWCFPILMAVAGAAHAQRAQLAPDALRRVVEIVAHDSMAGRATPSRELNVAAGFLASELKAAGLTPLGDDGTFLQRFPITETIVEEGRAGLTIGALATWRFGTDYWHVGGMGGPPFGELRGPVVIVSGKVTRETAPLLDVKKRIVIYRSPLDARGTPTNFEAGFALGAAGALAVLVVGERSDALWGRLRTDPDEHKPMFSAAWESWTATAAPRAEGVIRFMPLLEVWGGRFGALVVRAGIDTSAFAPASSAPRVMPLGVEGVFKFDRRMKSLSWAPNVIGMVPGSDPVLKHEFVVVSAHVDHLGRPLYGPPGPASVYNGADDNASGVAAMLQMAKALAAGPRPKRSVMFVAVSGEELGLWGSDYFVSHPPVPRASIIANVNLDMIGRSVADTLYLTGVTDGAVKSAVDRGRRGLVILGERALDARYPNEHFDERSDHVNFRRREIPSVWFFTGTHADYHETTDDPATLNYDALSRIANLALDVTIAVAAR